MYRYTGSELTNKIHTFLAKKSQKFPEINSMADAPVRKIAVREYRGASFFEKLENLNSMWGNFIRS